LNDAAFVVRRIFPESREHLFRAWSDPAELAEWFSPQGYCNPSDKARLVRAEMKGATL
jgi:uncharacterized protein YndB with AHSA1/START domain